MKRGAGWLLLLLCACPRKEYIDPNEGAIHLPRIGEVDQYGRTDHARPTEAEDPATARKPTPGSFGADIDVLQRIAERSWASRERHEELDGVDIEAVFADMRKSLGTSTNPSSKERTAAFPIAVRKALCRLGDTHFRLDEKSAGAKRHRSYVDFDVVAGSFVVSDFDKVLYDGGKGPSRGDVVVKADGQAIAEWSKFHCLVPASSPAQREIESARIFSSQWRLPEEKPKPAKLTMRRPNGGTYTLTLKWRADTSTGKRDPCVTGRQLDGRVGVLTIHTFACTDLARFEQELQAGIDAMGRPKDVIVDMRHYHAPASADPIADDNAQATAARLVTEAPAWTRYRHHVAGQAVGAFADEPFEPAGKKAIKAKHVWVLTGPRCFANCEIFVSVLSTAENVTLVGQRTAGAVGNPKPQMLPKSQLMIGVPSTEYAIPGTIELIEGKGVEPDVEVRPTLDDAAHGRDTVLDAVLRRLQQ